MDEKPNLKEDKKIDVLDILRDNTAVHREKGEPLKLNNQKSRKKRDYIVCMLVGNFLIFSPSFIIPGNSLSQISMIYAHIIFSVGLTFIMWIVMSDY